MADLQLSVIIHLLQLLNFPYHIPKDSNDAASLINTLSAQLANENRVKDFSLHPNPPVSAPAEIYDFIVVGGGTAGSIVANRLSANEKHKVLLLEAGGDPTILNSIPGLIPMNMHQKDSDWHYKALPGKEYSFAMKDKIARWTRYKGLGGCSSHNWLVYNRGHPKDFDNWANVTGDVEWNYEHVLKYFKKFENYKGKHPNDKHHGTGGPFHIGHDDGLPPSIEPWVAAAKELGYKTNLDFNADQSQTFGRIDLKVKNGERMDTYNGYIKPILNRQNFKVIRYAHVHKIEIDDSNKATGVVYKRNGELIKVKARKEIVVSGGSINSPQLLMLSGIGPKEHLESVGIKPKVNLPGVGQNLQDHIIGIIGPFLLDKPISFLPSRDMKREFAEEYASKRTGYFATNAIAGLGHFSSSLEKTKEWADVQVFQFPVGVDPSTSYLINQVYSFKEGLLEGFLEPYMGMDAHFGGFDIGRPKSVGSITLASNNPEDHPIIDPNYFDHPDDIQVQIDGIKFLVNMYENTAAWKQLGARLASTPFPGCESVEFKSDKYWECIARHTASTLYHPSGTCKMGRLDDPMAVVDTHLRVIGVKGLRVADASIMPNITNSNLNTPTLMIGEKAADLILSDHRIEDEDGNRDEL